MSTTLVSPYPDHDHPPAIPRSPGIHRLFEEQAALTPAGLAILAGDTTFTYEELDRRANALAMELRRNGVERETLVGVCVSRCPDLVVAVLAVLKAGAAYVPIDPKYPKDRIEYILADASAPLLVTQRSLAPDLPATGARRLLFVEDAGGLPALAPDSGGDAGDLAYVIYTSGSTGLPKGVAIEHRSTVALIEWARKIYEPAELAGVLFSTSICFDLSVFEMFVTLACGGAVILAGNALDLRNHPHRDRITLINTVPSAIAGLLDEGLLPPSAKVVNLAGEALSAALADRVHEALPGVKVYDLYGPSEDTTYSTFALREAGGPASIGRPIEGTSAWVLDAGREPVPAGVAGELYLGGAGLARGYLHRPELTAQKFIEHPEYGRLYRTGDSIRRNAAGDLEYLGRIDRQLKIRGFRIEPGEVETVLSSHPEVAACAVVPRWREGAADSLAAFLVLHAGSSGSDSPAWRRWLAERLPEYMVPASFAVIEALPLTPNGKIDRKELEARDTCALPDSSSSFAEAESPLEMLLASIWQDVLRVPRIGLHDDFLALGGHSLLAMRIAGRLSSELRHEVPLRWIFECRSIRGLARHLEAGFFPAEPVLSIPLADRSRPLPMSRGQQRFWLLDRTLPDPAAYYEPFAFHIRGKLDAALLRRSLQVLLERHEILRTVLVNEGGELLQRILPAEGVALPWLECGQAGAEAARERLDREARRPFDMAAGPLWRAVLIPVAGDGYFLLTVFHHAVIDEWSARLLFDEWQRLYHAGADPSIAALEDLPVQYADFAGWQDERLAAGKADAARGFWTGQLKSPPAPLELPADLRPPATPSGAGAVLRFTLPDGIAARLGDLAAEEGTTLFSLVLAAFQAWLHRISGSSDFIVAAPVARRQHPDLARVPGFFLNTLPLRCRVDRDASFRSFAGKVREECRLALAHDELPFEEIAGLAGASRGGSQPPLHQVMFVLLEEGLGKWKLGEACGTPLAVDTGTAKCDLILSVLTRGSEPGWECELAYSTELFSAEAAAAMAEQFRELLRAIADAPDECISRLKLIPPAQEELLGEWNRTGREFPAGTALPHERFAERARRCPDAAALAFEGQELSYGELAARADSLAWHLRSLGVRADALVGICLERSPELVVAVLAVLKAGGACLPLDPEYPAERLQWMLEDARPAVIVTGADLAERLSAGAAPLVLVDRWKPEDLPADEPPGESERGRLAYVLFTSGSTGRPKGVALSQAALHNLIAWQLEAGDPAAAARTLQFASLSFDVSFQEIFATLCAGGTLVMVPEETRRDLPKLAAVIREQEVTRIFVPFVVLDDLARLLVAEGCSGLALREVITAGEQLRITPAVIALFQQLPGAVLVNQYGPTETHVVTAFTLTGEPGSWPHLPPIGRPVANTRIHVIDGHRQEVPVGLPGELCVGGPQLARGYLNRPDLTDARFVVHPQHGRIYRTGDLVRWNHAGELEYLGRIDRQLKIRGFRIEPGEIEAVLSSHPEVAACAVVPRRRDGYADSLAAFLVLRAGSSGSDSRAWRCWLARHLPDYMVPGRFAMLDALPLSPNGKVDRALLEARDGQDLPAARFVAPQSPLEVLLAGIWQEVLQVPRIGRDDDFFALGGHSILAIRVAARIASELHREVGVRSIFVHGTVGNLARHLEAGLGSAGPLQPIPVADRSRPLAMSYGQQRFWLLHQTLPDPAAYHVPVTLHLRKVLDPGLLKRGLQVLLERHEILRTALVMDRGDLLQRILPPGQIAVPWQELEPLADAAAAAERIEHESRQPFDLARAPLWRAMSIPLRDGGQILLVVFHHAIIDEWSGRLFFTEWERLYAAGGDPVAAALPVLPVQYADFAAWQRERHTGPALDAARGFWRRLLEHPPAPLELPADLRGAGAPSGAGRNVHFTLPGGMVSSLRTLALAEEATLFSLILAAFQVWLHRISGSGDFIVATPSAHRPHPDVEHLPGFFLNTLPLRARVESGMAFRDFVRKVRDEVHESLDHAELPFEQIIGLSAPPEGGSRNLLHQVMFVLVEEEPGLWGKGASAGEIRHIDTRTAKCELTLSIVAGAAGWECGLNGSSDLFSAEAAAAMAEQFRELLTSIAVHPDEAIGRLNLLSGPGKELLDTWNATARDYPRDQCIHQLFERQVEETPAAVAVVFQDRSMTYRELDERADRISAHLSGMGVEAGSFVGVCLLRGPDTIATLLAILKAGAAYLALDPEYPAPRLAFMVGDARPGVIVTLEGLRHHFEGQQDSRILCLDGLEDAGPHAAPPRREIGAEAPAYVSYTSGSTGVPKGVVVPHRGVVRLVMNADFVELGTDQVLLHAAPLAFDASTFEIWGALLNGGCLALLPPGPASVPDIAAAIQRHGVTTLWLTAGLFHLLIEERPESLRPLRQLLAGGDVLSPEHVRKALGLLPACRVINGYGPTENTTFTCCHTVSPGEDFPHGVPIGRPVGNTRVHVLDAFLRPVPAGVKGELCTGGDGLATGYLNRPELTAEKFIDHPEYGRIYRSGDLVRWNHEGNLEFFGRIDRQLKIRGFRIEPGEIEKALDSHPAVLVSAVVPRRREGAETSLAAFLVLRGGAAAPDLSGWRRWLGGHLPDSMIPAHFAVLDSLPIGPNGKLDRAGLEAIDSADMPAAGFAAPRTPLEKMLAAIWQDVLQVPAVGLRDDFFALGGHSLVALRVAARVEKQLGRSLPISSFLQAPTLEAQALLLERGSGQACIPLVVAGPGASHPPVFFIHGLGGDVFGFARLARELGPDQPVFGIRAMDMDGCRAPFEHLEGMAVAYVDEIMAAQPEGAYYLAGYSLGGWIAYEIAHELKRRGKRVAMLALFDTHPNCQVPWLPFLVTIATYLIDRASGHWAKWKRLPVAGWPGFFAGRLKALNWWLGNNSARPASSGEAPVLAVDCENQSNDRYGVLVRNYRAKPYAGDVDLFLAEGAFPRLPSFWNLMTRGEVDVHRVPLRHNEMMSDDGAEISSRGLRMALSAARARDGGRN